ncbi:hypothetical protein [Owenweeksia hongkongensis]|uniref:hypothetical protein n=1 Tax=Owenweeksia hongkongensis TaxID=253245 RepID=UPI003A8FFFD3
MKRSVILVIAISLYSINTLACDICGCGAGMGYLGVLPQFNQNIAGVRFQYSNFLHPSNNINSNDASSQVLEDRFFRTEAWMRYYPADRWQLFLTVPYSVNQRLETQRTTEIQGVGDISANINYTLVDYGDSITSDWKNLLLLGGGATLPSGKYQQRDDTKLMLPAGFQVGSGAFSYNLHLIHTLRYRTWGLNTNLRYTFNGENELTYDYGNQLSAAIALFYWGETQKFAYLPSVGIGLEHFDQDYQYDQLKEYSGGTFVNLTIGVDLYIKRLLINTFAQIPLSQEIPSAQPAGRANMGIGVAYFFGKEE